MEGKSKLAPYATALAVLGALLLATYVFVRTRPAHETSRPPAAVQDAAPVAMPASPPEDPAPPEVLAAKAELRAEYTKQKGSIPEEVAKPIEDDIGVIEGVAADLLAAIASEPDNEDLKLMLIETYRNEMKLLKKALHLSSAEDEVTAEDPPPPSE